MKNIFAISLIFAALFLHGQRPVIYNKAFINDPQVKFIRLTTNDGLSHNHVTDIIQDNYGFVWVRTVDGLNRYDGNSFEVYTNNEDNFVDLDIDYCNGDSKIIFDHCETKKTLENFVKWLNE